MVALILLVAGFILFGLASLLSLFVVFMTWDDFDTQAGYYLLMFLLFGALSTVCGIVGGVQAINTIIHEAKAPVAVQSHR